MSIETILVPIDGSDLSEAVLKPVHRVLAGIGGVVTIVRFVRSGEFEDWPSVRAAREKLLAMVSEEEADSIKTHLRVEKGEPAEGIAEYIRTVQPDLVAMATHGRTGLARLVKGSVTETVVRSCGGVPILLCNAQVSQATDASAPYSRILVPLDGSDLAQAIFPCVVDLAKAFGSEVVLMRIADGPLHEGSVEYESFARYLNRFADRLAEAEVSSTRLHIASGDPATTILEAVEEERVDLVAITTHGRTGLDRLRMGSVAEEVLRQAPCPVLVMSKPRRATVSTE